MLSAQPANIESEIARYGMHLGTAFQLVDDVLDYSDSSGDIGKNIGDDLAEGKPTLPHIYSMRVGNPEQQALISQVIEHGGRDQIDAVKATIESTGAIAYTAKAARAEADQVLKCLANIPDSQYKQALIALAEFSVNRTY